jgi:hypothetical protein
MGYEAKKTEHCGPKRGNGAYWGYKWEAKKESNRIRRENWKREIRAELIRLPAPALSTNLTKRDGSLMTPTKPFRRETTKCSR